MDSDKKERYKHAFQVGDRVKIGDLKVVAGSAARNAKLRGWVTGVELNGTCIRVVWDSDTQKMWAYRDTDLVHCNNAKPNKLPKKQQKHVAQELHILDVAAKMMSIEVANIPTGLRARLLSVNQLVERAGGKLQSRQVIASIIAPYV